MKNNIVLQTAGIVIVVLVLMLVIDSDRTPAQNWPRQNVETTFEVYRKAIKDAFKVDIKNFKEKLKGGIADGSAITNYDLGQLLEGIKWEREHVHDIYIALELAMDHLERIPDYYTRLLRLERDAMSDRLLLM